MGMLSSIWEFLNIPIVASAILFKIAYAVTRR